MSAKRSKGDYHITLEPKKGWFDFNLKEIWQYRDLIWQTTIRSFKLSYTQTVLGPIWIFLSPLLSSFVYMFVFGEIAGIDIKGVPPILFYVGGNAIWSFFASCLTQTASTFTSNAGLFGKVYFPRLTMPISTVLSAVMKFGIQMIIFFVFWIYYIIVGKVQPNYFAMLFFPLLLAQLGILGLGCGIIISSITTKYRDLSILVDFGTSLWMYITPVVYPLTTLGDGFMRTLILANPVTHSVELFRYMFMGQGSVSPMWIAITCAITLLVLMIGIVMFSKVEKTFMDTV